MGLYEQWHGPPGAELGDEESEAVTLVRPLLLQGRAGDGLRHGLRLRMSML